MSTQRMYAVEVTATVMVVAESPADAERVARGVIREGEAMDAATYHATTPREITSEWRNCRPWGEIDEDDPREPWSVEQWLDAQREAAS